MVQGPAASTLARSRSEPLVTNDDQNASHSRSNEAIHATEISPKACSSDEAPPQTEFSLNILPSKQDLSSDVVPSSDEFVSQLENFLTKENLSKDGLLRVVVYAPPLKCRNLLCFCHVIRPQAVVVCSVAVFKFMPCLLLFEFIPRYVRTCKVVRLARQTTCAISMYTYVDL